MTCVALTSLAVIYNGLISIMLRHNIQKDGFEIAQLEMANLEQSSRVIGETREERANFEIETKIIGSAELAETNKLEVIVFEKGKTRPLVNLVRYE
ncbi:MAG: hypothetical protein AB9883_10525 [Acidaminococcaceae bacterium]